MRGLPGLPGRGGRRALLDVALTHQVPEDQVEENRLQLVVIPPPVRHGAGTIRLPLGSTIFGQVEITLCELDRRAVLLHLEVELKHRRRPLAIAFWARVGVPGPAPAWACSHQIQAGAVPENARWTRWW
ncbi:hypothetical protein OG738_09690 [Amycolatopsis sp. NBC_01488]|uniref:hypothetical protein n=1 Tax=Amycolatopsis sp. NBC_01488 TaxID=2903563 RepID=UPI002E2866E2|nr:hypothetical protein [Amycolatopsis sp. NBC_01488]